MARCSAILCWRFGDEFGGGRGRGGAQVGHEIGDGEIGLVADGGDHRQTRPGDGAGHALAVESGQVFKRSATAGEHDDVDERVFSLRGSVELDKCGFDLGGGLVALYGDGKEEDAQSRVAPGNDVEKVANDCAGWRGDDAHGAWKGGQRLLAIGVEEAFIFEALLELLEGELKRACAHRLHGLGHKLHLAALLVDAHTATN